MHDSAPLGAMRINTINLSQKLVVSNMRILKNQSFVYISSMKQTLGSQTFFKSREPRTGSIERSINAKFFKLDGKKQIKGS